MTSLRHKLPFQNRSFRGSCMSLLRLYADTRSVTSEEQAFRLMYRKGPQSADGVLETAISQCLITEHLLHLLGAYTPFYAAYAGTKAPVEHFTRAASKEFGERGISVTAIGSGPMDTPFFYPAEGADAVTYHKTAAALSKFSKTGLTDIEDIVPFIRFLVSESWWMSGQTILVNGGYTTK
jgi:NAD(P)-dependent dehydrogenase (short-subunit alcohol dehydrogenase family)